VKNRFLRGFCGVFGPPDEVASVRESIDISGAIDTARSIPWVGSHGAVSGTECTSVPIESSIGKCRGWFVGDRPGRKNIP
jgi:hypothetical protein